VSKTCQVCGADFDPLDPDTIAGQQTICGECARARNFDELLWEAELEGDAGDEAEDVDGETNDDA
jgi:hypothetical protein